MIFPLISVTTFNIVNFALVQAGVEVAQHLHGLVETGPSPVQAAKKSYTSQKVKKSTKWYQTAFAPGEASMMMADEKKKKVAERAQERQSKQLREQDEDGLKRLCAAEVAAGENFQAMQRSDGREQVFSNLTRIGLLAAIREVSESAADSPEVAGEQQILPGQPLHCQAAPPLGAERGQKQQHASANRDRPVTSKIFEMKHLKGGF